MKYQTAALAATAMALVSTTSVAAEFLKPTTEANYPAFCDKSGKQYNGLHACFVADEAYTKQLEASHTSVFSGYLSDDRKNFVLLEDQNSPALSLLRSDKYSLAVKTWQVISPVDKPAEKCVFVRISNAGHPNQVHLRKNFCGNDPVVLPDLLWK